MLGIETSTATGSVAVGDASGPLAELVLKVGAGHSSALLPAAREALRIAGLTSRDLTGVVVGGGPGSFTGLRIAAATAKGMLQALHIPLYAYSGLFAAAAAHWSAPGPIWGVFDARRRDVFAACYSFDRGPRVITEPLALTVDELIDRARAHGIPAIFTGEGALRHRDELEAGTGGRVAPQHLSIPKASALLWLARQAPALGEVANATSWEPDYVRAAGVERIAAARAAAGEA
ncbi:tRNA (adenosine(37)-N6)-threonylcarbamoyltransferase complex dimerization subunit type 1 TsaB [soil metagenome]